jgi:hypothetical protein
MTNNGGAEPFNRRYHSGFVQARCPAAEASAFWIVIVAATMYLYAAVTADTGLFHQVGFTLGIQIAVWAACMIAASTCCPGGIPRISDPVVLTLGLSVLYLIYPSIAWCQGEHLFFDVAITADTASLLFFLHALFFLGLTAGYKCTAPRPRTDMRVDVQRLPSPWPLFLGAMLPLLAITVARLVSGGGMISNSTYGANWYEMEASVNGARTAGGATYLLAQILSKIGSYPIIVQGIGAGLLLARARMRPRKSGVASLILICAAAAAMTLVGGGGRSPSIIYVLVALIFFDTIAGPLRWRTVAPFAAAGLVFFFLLGYIRNHYDQGLRQAFEIGYQEFRSDQGAKNAGEFTGMLAKEALAVQITREVAFDGMYFVHAVLSLVPSQILPDKMNWTPMRDILARRMLGPAAADKGAGVDGTSVGDGYAVAGAPGVFMLAALFGIILGQVRKWGARDSKGGNHPELLRVALTAGLTGFTVILIRSDLNGVLTYVVYVLIIPWWVLRLFLAGNQHWMRPVPLMWHLRRKRPVVGNLRIRVSSEAN